MLTLKKVDELKPRDAPYSVADGDVDGLAIIVHPSGKKTWSLRYRFRRQQVRLTLGVYDRDRFTVEKARKEANKKLVEVDQGINPADDKRAKNAAMTVGELVKDYVEWAKQEKRSWNEDRRRLDKHILPKWKRRAVAEITRSDVKRVLDSIAKDAPVEANRVHALISKLLHFAIDHEVITINPIARLAKRDEQSRDRVFTHDEIRRMWTACDALPSGMAAFFKLRLLTAQRGGEIGKMKWRDVDLKDGWWVIPAEDSKNGLAHRVPLSPDALSLVQGLRADVDVRLQARRDAGKEAKEPLYVLAGARGKRQQSEAAEKFKIDGFHGHDLRRTAATLMASNGTSTDIIGKILNHSDKRVTMIYNRASYDAEKRIALNAWARQLTNILESGDGANVLPFAKG